MRISSRSKWLVIASAVAAACWITLWIRTANGGCDSVNFTTLRTDGFERSVDVCTFNSSLYFGTIVMWPFRKEATTPYRSRRFDAAVGDHGWSCGFKYFELMRYDGHIFYLDADGPFGSFAVALETLAPSSEPPPLHGGLKAVYAFALPFWFLTLLSGILPVRAVFRMVRSRRRQHRGLCQRCGYDLRASTGKCPECGTPIPAN